MENVMCSVLKEKRSYLFILMLLCFLVSITTTVYGVQCTPPPSGMVSWWGGDNNALDMVGGNNGTLQNGATFAPGMVGQAFSFDGTNQHIEFPGSIGDFGTAPFTVDFWMYTGDTDTTRGHYILGKSNPDAGQGWDIRYYNGTITVEGWSFEITRPITLNAWHHIAVSATASNIILYIDGAEDGTSARPSPITSTTNPFRIGYTTGFWPYTNIGFNGLVDEVEIFGRALSTEDIAAIYNAGSAGKCRSCSEPPSGILSWWTGDGNADDVIGGNNGTLMNGATFAAGMVSQAFSFDGVDDYVELPAGFADFTSGLTVALWANPTASGSWARFIDLGNGQANDNILFDRRTTSNDLSFEVYNEFGSNMGMAYSVDAITNNEWHHYAATLDASGKVKMYKDGLPLVMGADTSGVPNNVTRVNNYIGRSNWSYDAFYAGSMDEVQIFNRVLDADEIAAIYNAGSAGQCISSTFEVTATAGANGSLDSSTPSPATVNSGETATFIFNANTGYHIATITDTCGGAGYTNTSNAVDTYTYTTPSITGSCGVSATFAVNTYTVTPSAGANGSINPDTQQTVTHGNTIQFTVTPDNGYSASVGGSCGGTLVGNTYTTSSIAANCTVAATFVLVTPMPDLVVSSVYGPSSGVAMDKISVTVTIKNQGTAPLVSVSKLSPVGSSKLSPVVAKLYLSSDTVVTAGDISIGQIYVPSLTPGSSSAVTVSVTIPNITPGNYYIGAIADPANTVVEHKENNNSGYSATPINIKAAAPTKPILW